ncbi:MAG: PhoH family protein [Candidatus Tectomicrobia bacterium]|uniref:PhoH-like protein n=1 Tax=Tectimicrobiota bacterium TaxID=2528274 RepID=A0A932G073_UNCTE|nr:PhoH family protein [Candidatus Tectomicrobia bacterium]
MGIKGLKHEASPRKLVAAAELLGIRDENLKPIEKAFNVQIVGRDNELQILGEERGAQQAREFLDFLSSLLREGYSLQQGDLKFLLRTFQENPVEEVGEILQERIAVPSKRRYILPRSLGQQAYMKAIRQYDIVLGIGPAGTGKTYLAMAIAISALTTRQFNRIILTRPAVEAGERLGFLPGDLYEKVNPYLRPLYDALYDMMDFEDAQRLIQKGTIEIAPLAYMRGRTLNDSFIILDEAQNTTSEQMKMFLTRMGFNSKVVITGDITQIDLPEGKVSGLIEVSKILAQIEGIKIVYFSERDVVRHELVRRIIRAYEEHAHQGEGKRKSAEKSAVRKKE